jgi:hypothetical protein
VIAGYGVSPAAGRLVRQLFGITTPTRCVIPMMFAILFGP